MYKILNTLSDLDPYGSDPSQRGLVSGLIAHDSINVDDAKDVGQLILKSIVEKSITTIFAKEKKTSCHIGIKSSSKN